MAKTTTKAKVAPPPPATTLEKRTLEPHKVVLSPTVQSAVGIQAWSKFAGNVDLTELLDGLLTRVEKVQDGDMRPIEAMLYGQAMTLETIFTSLARRAASQEYLTQFQTHLTLALKAQAQCRATLETLAEIKNPRQIAFVRQVNTAHGPQQINNGAASTTPGGREMSANPEIGNRTASHAQNFSPSIEYSNAAKSKPPNQTSSVSARGQNAGSAKRTIEASA